jgi:hypothetical protein
MYVLYLDESGTHAAATYFVLAGLAVFEREIHWYTQDLDAIQERHFPDADEPVVFHATDMRAPQDKTPPPFDQHNAPKRRQILRELLEIVRNRRGVLFGVAIEKAWLREEDPYERAFEDLTSRFDMFLGRYNARENDEQRGLIVVSQSSYQQRLETLGRQFRGGSTRWRKIYTIADAPFFVPTANTRILQLADVAANAIFGRYNSGLTGDFDIIAPRFDNDEGRIHGLCHLSRDHQCQCPACLSRQIASQSSHGH